LALSSDRLIFYPHDMELAQNKRTGDHLPMIPGPD
jgi:hypothetical protein